MASSELTSARSPRVAAARRLAKRAFRTRERRFLAEGPQAVREAVAAHVVGRELVREVFVTREAAARHGDIVTPAEHAGIEVHLVSGEVMSALAQTVTPQGVVAVCDFLDEPLADVAAGAQRLVAVLAHVRDPGNAGTVIRTADAAGADAVVLSGESVDPYNGKCVRASAGSLFHLPLAVGVPVDATVSAMHARGLRVLAADGHGDLDLDTAIDEGMLDGPTAWVFGNEAWGLPPETRALADEVVRVPIHGRAESLNLATAAAVCLYASARAQRQGAGR
ncbi:MAG: methyltransferase, TrmH family [Actinomycetota bacterium]|nr:methyltransferase, TrmH family [Actinomycetota bacterium]